MENHNHMLELLDELLVTHSPPGEEDEIDAVLMNWFTPYCNKVFQDDFGNVIGVIKGKKSDNPLRIMAHKDEIGLTVKTIQPDGRLKVDMCGCFFPWKMGETPVDILGRREIVKGVLSIGSLHTSPDNIIRKFIDEKPVTLNDVHVTTTLSKETLKAKGISPGSRIVVAREFKKPIIINNAIAGYNLDDKLAVVVMQLAMEQLHQQSDIPDQDIYFIATSMEEVGSHGAAFASNHLPGHRTLALEIGPVDEEYDIKLNHQPVIWYGPNGIYHKKCSDALLELAETLRFGAQPAYLWGAGSDASHTSSHGYCSMAACLAFPCANTHGYEMADIRSVMNTTELLVEAINNKII
jgi:putative aminopeptidase FrvX